DLPDDPGPEGRSCRPCPFASYATIKVCSWGKGGRGVLALFREGFWRDALALVIVAVVLGGLAVGAIGRGVEACLPRPVSGVVGALREFDAVVHVREDTGD